MSLTEAQRAIAHLQGLALRASDGYTIDVLDRALDEIVRNPDNPSPYLWQVRSARANAAKVVQARREVVTLDTSGEDEPSVVEDAATTDTGYGVVEIREWLRTSSRLTEPDRTLLTAVADGQDSEHLAEVLELPVQRVRERLSRARKRAGIAYSTEVAA